MGGFAGREGEDKVGGVEGWAGEEGCGQGSVEEAGVGGVDEVAKVKNNFLGRLPQGEVWGRVFGDCPDDAVDSWFGCGGSENFGVVEVHGCEAVELSTF